tara:strand:+ start:5336 stop:5722 length:387 start_codon:yes stop_codon:yes gene_type:complete
MILKQLPFIDLDFAKVSMREDGIVNTSILLNDSITLEQAKELLAAYLEITKGINTPHLFTVTKLSIMDTEVMDFIKNSANKHGKADAFVINSLPQRIIGNAYLKLQSQSIPTKLFSSKNKAIEWLKKY